jgi:hypothetical protein
MLIIWYWHPFIMPLLLLGPNFPRQYWSQSPSFTYQFPFLFMAFFVHFFPCHHQHHHREFGHILYQAIVPL